MSTSKHKLLDERKNIYALMNEAKERLIAIRDELNQMSSISKWDGERLVGLVEYLTEEDHFDTTYDDALEILLELGEGNRPEVQRALTDKEIRETLLGDVSDAGDL